MDISVAEARRDKLADEVYRSLIAFVDDMGIPYSKNDAELSVSSTAHGDDLGMPFTFLVDSLREVLAVVSTLPIDVPAPRRSAVARAVCAANSRIFEGKFNYDERQGKLFFITTSSYADGLTGRRIFDKMLSVALATIDEYNDRLAVVALNDISDDQINDYITYGEI